MACAAAYVKSSAAVSGLCTPLTVTRTLTVPEPGGLTAEHVVAVAQPTVRAAALPKWTTVPLDAVLKPVPVIVTAVLPAAGPPAGVILVTEGCMVNWTLLLSPLCVPSCRSTVPTPGVLATVQRVKDVHVVLGDVVVGSEDDPRGPGRREEVRALDRDDGALRTCGRGDGGDRRSAEVRVVVGGRVEALLPVGGDANAHRAGARRAHGVALRGRPAADRGRQVYEPNMTVVCPGTKLVPGDHRHRSRPARDRCSGSTPVTVGCGAEGDGDDASSLT